VVVGDGWHPIAAAAGVDGGVVGFVVFAGASSRPIIAADDGGQMVACDYAKDGDDVVAACA
jgi:hypothetical protein